MGDFDFGEEHLKFMFERWKVFENLKETQKSGKAGIADAERFMQQARWFESRLNRYIGNLENWMEGTSSKMNDLD